MNIKYNWTSPLIFKERKLYQINILVLFIIMDIQIFAKI